MINHKVYLAGAGCAPVFQNKFNITQHPRYKFLSDYNKKNAFNVEQYIKRRSAIVKPDEEFDLYEIEV